jgi:hypothetical protein
MPTAESKEIFLFQEQKESGFVDLSSPKSSDSVSAEDMRKMMSVFATMQESNAASQAASAENNQGMCRVKWSSCGPLTRLIWTGERNCLLEMDLRIFLVHRASLLANLPRRIKEGVAYMILAANWRSLYKLKPRDRTFMMLMCELKTVITTSP